MKFYFSVYEEKYDDEDDKLMLEGANRLIVQR